MPLTFRTKAAQVAHQQSKIRAAQMEAAAVGGAPLLAVAPVDTLQAEMVALGTDFPALEIQNAIKSPRDYHRESIRKIVAILRLNSFPLAADALQKSIDVADVEDLLEGPIAASPVVTLPTTTSAPVIASDHK